MEHHKSTFQRAFAHLYYLMLSADKIADLNELELGNKIIALENLDKTEVMKDLDLLSAVPRNEALKDCIDLLKSISRKEQQKCLAYVKLIANADGSYDDSESDLLNEIGTNELNILPSEIRDIERELKQRISEIEG
ncbi:MAG: hypothetical protein MI975_12040 [Cytophagales bacterium]|nr:hypothetical protein [Cytophagales bacterium]